MEVSIGVGGVASTYALNGLGTGGSRKCMSACPRGVDVSSLGLLGSEALERCDPEDQFERAPEGGQLVRDH